jgi:hypothetical protein
VLGEDAGAQAEPQRGRDVHETRRKLLDNNAGARELEHCQGVNAKELLTDNAGTQEVRQKLLGTNAGAQKLEHGKGVDAK